MLYMTPASESKWDLPLANSTTKQRMRKKENSDDMVAIPEGLFKLISIILWYTTTHKHSATLWHLHTALQKVDGDVMPCTTVCVRHVCEGLWDMKWIFYLHQLAIRLVFNDRGEVKEERLQYRASSATPRGACGITVISNALINERL